MKRAYWKLSAGSLQGCIAITLAMVALMPRLANAEVLYWRTVGAADDWDWSNSSNFTNDVGDVCLPAANDIVVVPGSTDVYVKDKSSFSIASSLKGVQLEDSGSRIIFVIDAGADGMDNVGFNAEICSNVEVPSRSDYRSGQIVKRGSGTLRLNCQLNVSDGTESEIKERKSQNRYTYLTGVVVEEGSVRTPRNEDLLGNAHYFGHVSVSNGASFVVADYTVVRGLWGDGVVTNDTGYKCNFRVDGDMSDACEFGGILSGPLNYISNGRVMLTGTNSCHSGYFASYGHSNQNTGIWANGLLGDHLSVTGIKRIGSAGEGSSSGPGADLQIMENGGGFLYMGEGETTDKGIQFYYPQRGLGYFNAGAVGGVTFLGSVFCSTEKEPGWMKFVMTGTNVLPCVFAGAQSPTSGNDVSFVKQGSGTWRFADQHSNAYNDGRTFAASIEVHEGTLQFDSMEESGFRCALGLGTNFVSAYCGVRDDIAHRTEYAYLAGADGGTEAVFEFTGTNGAYATRRTMALRGRTVLRNHTARNWRFSGVKPVADGPVTLVLDSSEATESELAGIGDSVQCPVSVEKIGAGTWTLNGSNVIHGVVRVKEGVLNIHKVTGPYTWLKWSARGSWYPNFNSSFYLRELGVYDINGNQVNKGLTGVRNYHAVQPGQATVWMHTNMYKDNEGIAAAFGGTDSYWEFCPRSRTDAGTGVAITADDPVSWFPVVMRLADGAAAPVKYDFVLRDDQISSGSNARRVLDSWQMEGSADGIHWDLLSDITTNAAVYKAGAWYSNVESSSYGVPHVDGFMFSRTESSVPNTVLETATVSVLPGAELKAVGGSLPISSLSVDASVGMGTLTGFSFAENGTLSVENAHGERPLTIPAGFGGVDGIRNLAGWQLLFNGKATQKYRVSATDAGIRIDPIGFAIHVM